MPIHGQNDRRPDIVIYVNGLPLVVFELKNPYSEKPTVDEALNQIQHYTHDIPQLFDFNALVVVSDGVTTLHGMWTAPDEWYAPWKSIDGLDVEPNTTGSMKTLVEGLFPKDRLLAYIRDFIVFEVANDKITKKGAQVPPVLRRAPGRGEQRPIADARRWAGHGRPAHRRDLAHHRLGQVAVDGLPGRHPAPPCRSWRTRPSSSRWTAPTWTTSSTTSSSPPARWWAT